LHHKLRVSSDKRNFIIIIVTAHRSAVMYQSVLCMCQPHNDAANALISTL